MKSMDVEKSHKRNSEETKGRILDVALFLFAKNGFAQTTTREICEGANVNINLIYYYFGGKKELYDALILRTINKQTELIKQRLDINCDLDKLSYQEKINTLYTFIDFIVDFLYKNISKEQVAFFLQFQQSKEDFPQMPPAYAFIIRLMSSILGKSANTAEVVFNVLFLMSQIAFPRLVPLFSLKTLGQEDFNETDIKFIKEHIREYIDTMYLRKKD